MSLRGEVREFLESSTIHGLAHISTGKTLIVKALWIIIVITSFCVGISLIVKSYQSWELSPIITSVDTKPISEVTFPEITVCPPKGSNTALNLDLLEAEKVCKLKLDGVCPVYGLWLETARNGWKWLKMAGC